MDPKSPIKNINTPIYLRKTTKYVKPENNKVDIIDNKHSTQLLSVIAIRVLKIESKQSPIWLAKLRIPIPPSTMRIGDLLNIGYLFLFFTINPINIR